MVKILNQFFVGVIFLDASRLHQMARDYFLKKYNLLI